MIEGVAIARIKDWAKNHSNPDAKILVAGPNSYSPRELLSEVEKETPLGTQLLISAAQIFERLDDSATEKETN